MFDNLLRFGAAFDWITPLWTLIVSANRRPTVTYAIPAHIGGGPYEMGRKLRSWGAEIWGVDIYDDETIFHARRSQAQYIQVLLEKNGIPYRGGVDLPEGYPPRPQAMPPEFGLKQKREQSDLKRGILDRVLDEIDMLVDYD